MLSHLSALFRPTRPDSADRRGETRHDVRIEASLTVGGTDWPVTVADLSASGAMVNVGARLAPGETVSLHVPGFGEIAARVVHAGEGFGGLQFMDQASVRPKLAAWLRRRSR